MDASESLRITKFDCKWSIGNFSVRRETCGNPLDSVHFPTEGLDRLKWMLRLYPNGEDQHPEFVSLYLYLVCVDQPSEKITREIQLSLENHSGNKCHCHFFRHQFTVGEGQGYSRFISRSLLFQNSHLLLANDQLTVCCRIKEVDARSRHESQCKIAQLEVADDLAQLLSKPSCSDVVFNVKGHTFYAHKIILIARSPVFASLFKSHFTSRRQRVDVNDVDVAVFEELLRFVYTGRCDRLDQMADKLLAVSDQYQLKQLKSLCQNVLSGQLNIGNAAATLVLSHRHSADQLKDKSIEFINKHSNDVIQTSGWKTLVQSHPHLIANIYVKLLKKSD